MFLQQRLERGNSVISERFDDRMKALFGALSTLLLMVLVPAISLLERVVFGQAQISTLDLAIFLGAGLIVTQWLVLLGTSDRIGALVRLFVLATHSDAGPGNDQGPGSAQPRLAIRALSNLWIPVTLQFSLANWLIYATGGLSNSPYAMVPTAMMLIGQSVYVTPNIDLPDARARSLLRYALHLVGAYWYPLAMYFVMLVAVVSLQAAHPLVTRHAPDGEVAATTFITVAAGLFVVHVTRRVDQASARRRAGGLARARTPSS